MKKRRGYTRELPRQMYLFFTGYDAADGAPSFQKFARTVGMTVDELTGLRCHAVFDRAYRACLSVRRDYLIDRALTRKFDPSFVKFLLDAEDAHAEADEGLAVTVEVVP